MANIFKDGFKKDIAILLVVTIICGSLFAASIAYVSNLYFGKTIAGLIGEYGEYDLAIQVREEMKDDVGVQLQKIIEEQFSGAALKEGPTLTGKTTFFIALPDKYKTQQVYEDIDNYFGSLPGGGSVGIMTEPRLTVRGVPLGAQNLLLDRIAVIDGVRFAFRDGGSISAILTDMNKLAPVSEEIKEILQDYEVVEVSFPIGMEPANPIKMGETLAKDFRDQAGLQYAQNVTMAAQNSDMLYMVSTMLEMKRFLQAYAAKVNITPHEGTEFLKGDTLVLQGSAAQALTAGTALGKANVVVQITAVHPDKTAEGVITQGDALLVQNTQAFKLQKDTVGEPAGTVTLANPRQQLATALSDTSKLLQQVPELGKDVQQSTQIALKVLDNYDETLSAVAETRDTVQRAGDTISTVTAGLSNVNTAALQSQIQKSSQALGGMIESLKVLKVIQADLGNSLGSLEEARTNLNGLSADLQALNDLSANAQKVQIAFDAVTSSADKALTTIRSFDEAGARTNINAISQHVDRINAVNTPAIALQLQYLGAAVPNLKDEEIAQSVNLLDKFIAGQVIPGQRVQVLVNGGTNIKQLEPIIKQEAGIDNISVYTTPAGIIEPDARGELFKVLSEVKALLAAIVTIVFTLATLLLDHTVVMSTIRKKCAPVRVNSGGWLGPIRRFWASVTSPERTYGMVVGGGLLTSMFIFSGASIPYLPIWLVPCIGVLCGLLIAWKTETVSPVRLEEIMAGEAMGMTYLQIMREIVIPEGRPGFLQQLNKRKRIF